MLLFLAHHNIMHCSESRKHITKLFEFAAPSGCY